MDSKHRHELKQNEFAVVAYTLADRIAQHRTTILGVLGVLAVLAVIAGGVMAWQTRQANNAGAALGIALATAEAPVVPASTLPGAVQTPGTFATAEARAEAAIAAFTHVTTNFAGTESARLAAFHLAAQLLAGGKSAEAAQAFAALADEEGDTLRGQSARLGQAEALLASGQTDEALKIYTDLAAVREGPMPVDGLLMQLGRASQRAGRTAEARAAFQRVIDEFPESGFVMTAQQQLAAIN